MTTQAQKTPPLTLLTVTLANRLVEAHYTLPLREQRLILAMLARIQPNDEDFKECQISIHEFAELMGIDKNHVYTQCKKTTKALSSRVLDINEPDVSEQIHWVSSAHYIEGEGRLKLCFDPKLKPYLLQLQDNFTRYPLDILLRFKRQYTLRIYTLLKRYETAKAYEIELEQLRAMLGINPEQYTLYTNFKKDILETTRTELTDKADLTFEFEEIKYGRRVGVIRFKIFIKEQEKPLPSKQVVTPKSTANLLPPTSAFTFHN